MNMGRRRAVPLIHCIKWFPLLMLPLAALFFETWLNVHLRKNDFEVWGINNRITELQQELEDLKVEEARLGTMDRIGVNAPDLGLVEPSPSQLETVYCAGEGISAGQPRAEYDMANAAADPVQRNREGAFEAYAGEFTP